MFSWQDYTILGSHSVKFVWVYNYIYTCITVYIYNTVFILINACVDNRHVSYRWDCTVDLYASDYINFDLYIYIVQFICV